MARKVGGSGAWGRWRVQNEQGKKSAEGGGEEERRQEEGRKEEGLRDETVL